MPTTSQSYFSSQPHGFSGVQVQGSHVQFLQVQSGFVQVLGSDIILAPPFEIISFDNGSNLVV